MHYYCIKTPPTPLNTFSHTHSYPYINKDHTQTIYRSFHFSDFFLDADMLVTSSLSITFSSCLAPSDNSSMLQSSVRKRLKFMPSNRSLYPAQENRCMSLSGHEQKLHSWPHLPLKLSFVGSILALSMKTALASLKGNSLRYDFIFPSKLNPFKRIRSALHRFKHHFLHQSTFLNLNNLLFQAASDLLPFLLQ